MAKYLCSYSTVRQLGEETIKNAEQMHTNTATYDDEMKKDLLDDLDMYEGKARDAFDDRMHNAVGLVNGAGDIALYGNRLGNHVVSAAATIKSLDLKLAQLKI